jgi:hypothetical protein
MLSSISSRTMVIRMDSLAKIYRGHVDALTSVFVSGWAVSSKVPENVIVEVLVDGNVVGTGRCNQRREDLLSRGITKHNAGFRYDFEPPLDPFTDHEVLIKIRGDTAFLNGASRLQAVKVRIGTEKNFKPQGQPPRVAVLVRTHLVCPKLLNLLEQLKESSAYDLYVLADETRTSINITNFNVISHSELMCKHLGLSISQNNVLWMCGDYALYCAVKQLPEYDYYLQIEYDVHFVRQNSLFVEGIISRLRGHDGIPYDYIGAFLAEMGDAWVWQASASKVYPKVFGGIFAFVLVSQRALHYLFEQRKLESARNDAASLIHCEAFVPSALMNGRQFKCGQVNDLLPGSVSHRTFHPAFADLRLPNFLLGATIEEDPRVEMYHPVFDADAYLSKALTYAATSRTLPKFCEMLNRLSANLVPDELRDNYLAAAQKLNSLARSHA